MSKSSVNLIGYVYYDYFNVFKPSFNLFAQHNNSESNTQFNFEIYLLATMRYVLVVSTYFPNTIGNFSIFLSGPSEINVKRLSE